MKKSLLLLTFVFTFLTGITSSYASHMAGGEIRWECLPNGKYVFYMDVYRECSGTTFYFPSTQTISYQNGSILMKPDINRFNSYGAGNISPIGLSGLKRSCSNPSQLGATQMFPFVSDPVTLNGTPPAGGWLFTWTLCCRPFSIANITNPASRSFTLRARMYPHPGQISSQCFDSSPEFSELPAVFYCKGNPQIYNLGGVDNDMDSLVYSWDLPWDKINTPATFSQGYSFDNPLPDTAFHPLNVPAVLNNQTGEVSFQTFSGQSGQQFTSTIRVDSYRDGILIASVYRDAPFIGLDCPFNTQPSAMFDSNPAQGFVDTIYPGEFVDIPLLFEDVDFDSSSMQLQEIAVTPNGQNFSLDYADSTNCRDSLFGPCATLTPVPTYDSILKENVLKGIGAVNARFQWQTNCSHIGSDAGKLYNFIFKVKDAAVDFPGVIYPSLSLYVAPIAPNILHIGNTLFAADTADSYQWYFNDTLIPNSDINKIAVDSMGKYSLAVVKFNCPSMKTHYYYTNVGLLESSWAEDVKLYPNPFNEHFVLETSSIPLNQMQFKLMDISGREVKMKVDLKSDRAFILPDMHLKNGIYLLEITSENNRTTKKLIKM
mgnify:CR=1 FL=1